MDRQKIERSIKGLSEWQMHVQAESDIDANISTAIEALKAQLSQEGTTSDLISRTETAEHLRRVLGATVPITDYDDGFVDGVQFAISTVSTMPTIQPEKASVILGASKDGIMLWYKCSVCEEPVNANDNYCCNCGRKFINGRFDR